MSDTFSNVGGNTYFADLGLTNKPTSVMHGLNWRPHPILPYVPAISVPRGFSGVGIRSMADWTAAVAFSENTALTDQAMPTITSTNPTLVGRGFSYSQSVQGRQRVSDPDWARLVQIRDQKVMRVLLDDLTHLTGNANSIIALSASVTDITTDAAGNASLQGLLDCLDAIGRPAVAFYDAIGIRGLIDSIIADGGIFTSAGLSDQIKRFAEKWNPDTLAQSGLVMEIFGCKIYQTNERSGDGVRLYEDSSITHAIVMADMRARREAAAGANDPRYQYDNVVPPIVLMGREDPIPDMPAVNEPEPAWLSVGEGNTLADDIRAEGTGNVLHFAKWLDVGNNVAGRKQDFGGDFDPVLSNSGYIRCHQYLTAYQS